MSLVFISYARADGRSLALRLRDSLAARHRVWLDTREIEGGLSWSAEIERAIDACDVMVALMSAGSMASAICRGEHLRALRFGRPVIPVLVTASTDRPVYLEAAHFRDFSAPDAYATQLQSLLDDIERHRDAPLAAPAAAAATAPEEARPPAVPNLVHRADAVESLRDLVLAEGTNTDIRVTVIRGIGGSGKTALAAELCRDQTIRDCFPDGVFWLSVGADEGTPLAAISTLARALEQETSRFDTLERAKTNLRSLMAQKSALIVLDDVTSFEQVDPFRVDAPRSRVVVTTRLRALAAELGAAELPIPDMSVEQAVRLLENWARGSDPDFPALVKRLHVLPLALKIAGTQIRLRSLRAAAWMQELKGISQLSTSLAAKGDRERDLEACFDLSLRSLDAARKRLFYALGALRRSAAIPRRLIVRLWKQVDPSQDEDGLQNLLQQLEEMALVEPVEPHTVRMHDLLAEHALGRLADGAPQAHRALLASYAAPDDGWAQVPDDGYLRQHLLFHLFEANGAPALRAFLRQEDAHPERAWSSVRAPLEYAADLQLCARLGHQTSAMTLGDDIRITLALSSLQSLSSNVPAPLLTALVQRRVWGFGRAATTARQLSDARSRVDALLALASIAEANDRASLVDEAVASLAEVPRGGEQENLAVDAARQLQRLGRGPRAARLLDDRIGVRAFSYYNASFLYDAPDGETLREIERILNQRLKDDPLSHAYDMARLGAASHEVDPAIFERAVSDARRVESAFDRAFCLAPLVAHMAPDQRGPGLAEVLALVEDDRADPQTIVKPIVELLDPPTARQVAEHLAARVARGWGANPKLQLGAVDLLIPRLADDDRQAILEVLLAGEESPTTAPTALTCAHLDPARRDHWIGAALDRAATLEDSWEKAHFFQELALELNGTEIGRACAILSTWDESAGEDDRVDALVSLAEHGKDAEAARSVAVASATLRSLDGRGRCLDALAGTLAPDVLEVQVRALARAVRSAQGHWSSDRDGCRLFLLAHVDLLDDGAALANEMLEAALRGGNPTLREVCKRIPPRHAERHLSAILAFPDVLLRSEALTALAPGLSSAALAAVGNGFAGIHDQKARESCLASLGALLVIANRAPASGGGEPTPSLTFQHALLRMVSEDLGGWLASTALWAQRMIARGLAQAGLIDAAFAAANHVRDVELLHDRTLDDIEKAAPAARATVEAARRKRSPTPSVADYLSRLHEVNDANCDRLERLIPTMNGAELDRVADLLENSPERGGVGGARVALALAARDPGRFSARAFDRVARLDKAYQIETLALAVDHTPPDLRQAVIDRAVQYAWTRDYQPAEGMCIASCIADQATRKELLCRALEISTSGWHASAESARLVGAHVCLLPDELARQVFAAGLRKAATLDRRQLLAWLEALRFLILKVGDAADIADVIHAVRGVGRRWP